MWDESTPGLKQLASLIRALPLTGRKVKNQ